MTLNAANLSVVERQSKSVANPIRRDIEDGFKIEHHIVGLPKSLLVVIAIKSVGTFDVVGRQIITRIIEDVERPNFRPLTDDEWEKVVAVLKKTKLNGDDFSVYEQG
jgi:hypothetical protein